MAVGVLLIVVPLLIGHPLYLRGTRLPWGTAVVVIGVGLMLWDSRKRRPPTSPPASPPSS
jgi:hypothetical protein